MRFWLAFVVGCGAPAQQPTDAADAFLPSTECLIENVLVRQVGTAQLANCGDLAIASNDAQFVAAHDCASAAVSAQRPFVVEWQIQGVDSRNAGAYVGLATTTGWEVFQLLYDGDPSGGGGDNHPLTNTWQCGVVLDRGACADLHSSLCLTCDTAMFVDRCATP